MDATIFTKLARLLPVALVCLFITSPVLKAENRYKIEIAESNTGDGSASKSHSASGTLVILAETEPEFVGEETEPSETGGWRSPSRGRKRPSKAKFNDPSVRQASHREVVAAAAQTSSRADSSESDDSIAEMLIRAHELSQHATEEADYEDIAVACDTAERLGANGEQLQFAVQLQAWAIKKRDELGDERLQRQLRAEKVAQQLRAKQTAQRLRAESIEQQLRAEKAEEELQAVKLQRELRAELAKQQQRAEQAEQQLLAERAKLESIGALPTIVEGTVAEEVSPAGLREQTNVEQQEDSPEPHSLRWRELHERGVAYAEQGKYAEALDDFNRVIELNPMFAKAYSNRATLFTESNDLEQAQADYEKACTLNPELLHAQLGLGRVYHLQGQREKALDCFNRAVELDPDNANIICSRADLLADMGKYRDALSDYARTIELNPDFAHAYRNGAWLLATCPDSRYRDPVSAVAGAERALEFDYGERHVALDTLAAAQAAAGNFDQAAETLQEALKTAPHETQVVYRSRLQKYQAGEPFFTDPVEDVSQAVYEVSDY